ncbi:DUF6381 family protein [Streptomyces sp. Je 1-79]|uniref:DUF6381 family protein n=1 Tax=Streptomyces sp. Je 1-79 TaxID=2943847 RepID=UPI0021A91967|nr:DUF6381 family protein [Streptomyces sp. Je 1-79]MCT4352074.1 DUF6381 family protein [Streptomyces sp. Je 1-79]
MSVADEFGDRIRQMRAKAQKMEQDAEQTTDPQERQRLTDKARRLKQQSDRESSEGIDPM